MRLATPRTFAIALLAGIICVCQHSLCQSATPFTEQPTAGEWGDRSDGSFANPILPADFSDLDAIRVGSSYYAISSTM